MKKEDKTLDVIKKITLTAWWLWSCSLGTACFISKYLSASISRVLSILALITIGVTFFVLGCCAIFSKKEDEEDEKN